ncbi:MAG: 50S ribosomal protein L18e [Candidatus Methanoperedens sp.]|nr:50S ribosomal protein L18e [Candidatus Methanoperedens sp.]MCE8424848.1 50S ribosomal protein L18e [Candidatus Methanoperedens sp.]MCE8427897.1 50S ribosomal protein L18e [Candidatus Methanoperedens sp.]
MKHNYKTNIQLLDLISGLKKQSRETEAPLWRDIAMRFERPTRNSTEVNLSRINRYTKEKDLILVPGKVLGAGELEHPLTVAAYSFSGSAKAKIIAAGGSCMSIQELINTNPEGNRVKIIG